jgi:hypothetical protein
MTIFELRAWFKQNQHIPWAIWHLEELADKAAKARVWTVCLSDTLFATVNGN